MMQLLFWRYIVPDAIHYTENSPYFENQMTMDEFADVAWLESWQEPGSFSALMVATPERIRFFWDLDLIVTRPESDRAMMVETMEMISQDDGDYIRISGRSAEAITDRRIIMQRGDITMTAQAAILYYIRENIGDYWYENADDDHRHGNSIPECRRFINLFQPGQINVLLKSTISCEPFGENLCDFIMEICTGNEIGFRVIFDGEKLLYSCYQGDDRTLNQSERGSVVFSEDFKNIGYSRYVRSVDDYYTHVIASGSGTGKKRQYGDAYADFRAIPGVGFNMKEGVVNSSGVSDDLLVDTAKNTLMASRKTSAFEVTAVSGGPFQYRRDYFLGDKVSVVNKFGISGTAIVTEVAESENENGFQVIPTLDYFDADEYFAPEKPVVGYRFLEYIKNVPDLENRWSYVLTDIIPDYDTRTELDIKLDSNTSGYVHDFLFGYCYADCAYSIDIWTNGANLFVTFYDGDISGSGEIRFYPVPYDRLTAILERGTCQFGDESVAYAPAVSVPAPASGMPFFARTYAEGEIRPMRDFRMRLYSTKLYKGGVLIHHLVPAERISDGAVGLFDNIGGKFYEGTHTFEKGDYIQ